VELRSADGVLITGVYGSGKSTLAAEIAYLLERRRRRYALLDLDYLGWGVDDYDDDAGRFGLLFRNLAAVASNYRNAGIRVFVVAWFVRDHGALREVRRAVGAPLRVVRLSVPLSSIERRLASDLTTERSEELREAAASITAREGVGVEDVVVANDRPVGVVAHEVMAWLGWL
jgi:adenylylsulfate kinase-like enzyme